MRFERGANECTGDLRIARFEKRRHCVVVAHVQVGPRVESKRKLRLGIREPRHAVEKQLEADVVSSPNHSARNVEVAVGKLQGVIDVLPRLLDRLADVGKVLLGASDAGEGEGFNGDEASDFKQVFEVPAPGRVGGFACTQEKGEGFWASGFAPVGNDGSGAVPNDDEAKSLKAGEGSAEGEAG